MSVSPPNSQRNKPKKTVYTVLVKCPRCEYVFLDILVDPIECPVCGFTILVNELIEVPE